MKLNILLLELTNQPLELLTDIFAYNGYKVSLCRSSTELGRYLSTDSFEYLVVNGHLPHPTLLKQINILLMTNPLPVVMFVRSSDKSLTDQAIRCGVSALVVDGFDMGRLRHIMDVAKARFDDYERLKNELKKFKLQLADRKSIDKAKGILMKRRAIDESTASDLIRKMAMDRNQNLAQVANSIIDVDELPI